MRYRFLAGLVLVAGVVVTAASACDGPQQPPTCTDIPDGGCPVDNDADCLHRSDVRHPVLVHHVRLGCR